MKKSLIYQIASVLALAVMLAGCACHQPSMLATDFKPQVPETAAYKAKVDNFMVIFDASASMDACYNGSNRLNTARAIVGNLNRTLPEMALKGALRSFGQDKSISGDSTVLLYGVTDYSTSAFQTALDRLTKATGNSPLTYAIEAAGNDFAAVAGSIALIVVSDGQDMGSASIAAAQKLKEAFGQRLCIYTIHIGDNKDGGAHLKAIADAGGCGYATDDSRLASSAGMLAFVQDVFLEKRLDSDGDGVYDGQDICLNTPAGTNVDARGCPLDSDLDGVFDDQDACPGTAGGTKVDDKGCPVDTDGDGIADYMDNCPNTPAYTQVDDAGCPIDSDQDGVADYMDKCPNTRKGAGVDESGCPLDSDGDGIVDYMDNCPGTPKGTQVDYAGCPRVTATKSAKVTDSGTWLYEDIQFDTGSAKIKSVSYPVLDEIAKLLTDNPSLKVEIQGHTDSAGSRAMNMRLSKERANSVAAYLVNKGVTADQLTTAGYGPTRPVASNDSAAGRAKNRRVELKPMQ
jgi:outer membrane protein OmpA-like peptidoglycan-associated protein